MSVTSLEVGGSKLFSSMSQAALLEILQSIAHCTTQYKVNGCDSPPPALVAQCSQWELCASRNPVQVGRGRLVVEVLAELVQGFVEGLGWKVLLFTLTSLSFLTLFVHSLLSLGRSRMFSSATHPPIAPPPHMLMPQTPYRHPKQGGYLSPAPTPSWAHTIRGSNWVPEGDYAGDMGTPTRRTRRRVNSQLSDSWYVYSSLSLICTEFVQDDLQSLFYSRPNNHFFLDKIHCCRY